MRLILRMFRILKAFYKKIRYTYTYLIIVIWNILMRLAIEVFTFILKLILDLMRPRTAVGFVIFVWMSTNLIIFFSLFFNYFQDVSVLLL